eukprot:TRINITY_DN2182_c0_g1_i1.p1 TRINITY_DN2182_c0_g1~~TRINITY_DN2182_c0_g1_i1.p1  ORF type:complete len:253 (+),score=10.20 TRINITY_DN2182_c0_g1_i1:309-1067(+)
MASKFSHSVALVLIFLVTRIVAEGRHLIDTTPLVTLDTSTDLPEGASCQLSVDLNHQSPTCGSGLFSCLVHQLPEKSANGVLGNHLTGICRANYASEPYCTVGEFNFAVGVSGIPMYGPSTCETCTCKQTSESSGSKKATCECDPLPECYIGTDGEVKGDGCPHVMQTQCVITSPGDGPLFNGMKTSRGRCQAPQVGSCVSAGPNWGPFFYAEGTTGVPLPGDRCSLCTCGAEGEFQECVKVKGCTEEVATS